MRRSSPRALSSPRARSRRRAKTSGDRKGSWAEPMRNAECGVRNGPGELRFRIPNSAFRIGYAAATAPATVTNSRRCIVLAPPHSAAYITRPPRRVEGGSPMPFEARIEPLTGKLPKVSYRWDQETDILSVAEPAKDARVVFPGKKSQPRVAAVEVDTALTVEKNQAESVLHIRVGRQRVASVVRVADLLLVEVDKNSRLAGLWFLDVPPFPNVEATA